MLYVADCEAMGNLLAQRQNKFYYHDYMVNVCAGTKAGVGLNALAPVLQSMNDPFNSKTITLACGKLTTGVTVHPWAGVFMLRNLQSNRLDLLLDSFLGAISLGNYR